MASFIRAGMFIINIDAIAKIEDHSTAAAVEVHIYLVNSEYIVLRGAEAMGVLDFFATRASVVGEERRVPGPCTLP